MKLFNKQDFRRMTKFPGRKSGPVSLFLMELLSLNKLNRFYESIPDGEQGMAFLNMLFKKLRLEIAIDEGELEKIPLEGPFITVSNHPFGMLDELLLIKIIGERRPDFKIMAHLMLQRMTPLQEFVLPGKLLNLGWSGSNEAIRNAKDHLASGMPLGLFPAGELSSFQSKTQEVSDPVWQKGILSFIQGAKVPVLPVCFTGLSNSIFHLLTPLNPLLRSATLTSGFINRKKRAVKVRIGWPISPKEQEHFGNPENLGLFLRSKTYALGSALEVQKFFLPNLRALKKAQEIVSRQDEKILKDEIEALRKDCLIHTQNNFEIFTAPSRRMPHLLNEIGRLREVTFREVGEGTNRSTDLDEYDLYFNHLFVWDKEAHKVVGAYRIGKGKEILSKYGLKGFYIRSLFKIKSAFEPVLSQTIELGRSFIVQEYQQKPLPLFLLWKGILYFLLSNPEYRYLIGPVSISNQYSQMSKSLMIAFIKKHFYNHELAAYIKPKKDFEVNFKQVDQEALLSQVNDLNLLDKIIQEVDPSHFRVPVLLKKYIKQNAQIIGFNIDPKFNDALDGLMILDLQRVPEATIANLKKEFSHGPVQNK